MSFLAPQAYTKETLSKAFDWLQHQPEQVKQVATSPDTLVSLYLKAQRQGVQNIDADAPVSSKKFIDDLKGLKKDFAAFEEPSEEPSTEAPQAMAAFQAMQEAHQQQSRQEIAAKNQYKNTYAPPPKPTALLDEQSMASVQQIQQRFNLSSPQEALRMLVSVGYQHISRWQ